MQKNQDELCEIVVRLLEKEIGVRRGKVTYPERDGSGPPVEMRVELGKQRYALEHTIIEPFKKAIQFGKEFAEFVNGIITELDGKLPVPGTYQLRFPIHPTAGRHRRTHAALQTAIMDWMREAARDLHVEMPERVGRDRQPRGYNGSRTAEVDGLSIALYRQVHWSDTGMHDGRLSPSRVMCENIEELRRARIRTALDRKLGKLADCARAGDRTMLILEDNDIALSNQILIAQALEAELGGRKDCPDRIFIAETCCEDSWSLFQPVINARFSIDMERIDARRVGRATSADQP